MHPCHRWALATFVVLVYLLPGLLAGAPARAAPIEITSHKDTIVIGRVTKNPRKSYAKLERFVGYLAHQLRPFGISRGEVRIAPNNRQMIKLFREGKVDFMSETIMSALLMEERAKAEILLREWKKGRGWYWSIIIARPESGVRAFPDLRGRKIAFEDSGSTVSFLVPLALMRLQGLKTVQLKSYKDPVPAGMVGYVFAGKEINIAAWVERKFVDAGALSNWDWLGKGRTPRTMREDIGIVYKSRPLVRSLFLARAGLPENIKQSVKKILLGLHQSESGKRILKNYYKVKKYDEIKGEVAESLKESRELYSMVRDRIG